MGDEVLGLGDLFGSNLLPVEQVVPSAGVRGIQVEEPHLQRELEVVVQACCPCFYISKEAALIAAGEVVRLDGGGEQVEDIDVSPVVGEPGA